MGLQIRGSSQILEGTVPLDKLDSNGGEIAGNLTLSGTTVAISNALSAGTFSSGGVDINGGTIDGTTIATSNITVGASKTLDVSAGTLTLANDQISGDKINGGTIDSINIDSVNIDGGSIDNTAIGATTASSASFTTLGASGATTLGSTLTVTGDLSVNTDKFTVNSTSGNASVGGNLSVTGNLIVNGSTTTVNSTTVTIDDPIFTLGGDGDASEDDDKDRGIEFKWHDGSNAKLGFFGYDDSAEVFTFIKDASNSLEVFDGSAGNAKFGAIEGSSFSDGTISGVTFVDEDNMASDSAVKIPTQQSVKAYVDSKTTSGNLDLSSLKASELQDINYGGALAQYDFLMANSSNVLVNVYEVVQLETVDTTVAGSGQNQEVTLDVNHDDSFESKSMVFLNGMKLRYDDYSGSAFDEGDYYFSAAGTITFKSGTLTTGDELEIRYIVAS